ncbi:MAG: T9SS type A sorting domain-containing protein [Bacteroidetes bacterium]|nr:T9SS type A sorting domain-containing protein [Bacteroidota bacterium]MBS1940333.1 T9SS type A sorting domain-containing protein [Bacteroidota bacterium]
MSFSDSLMTLASTAYQGHGRSSCISDTSGQFLLLVDDTGIRDAQFNLLTGASAMALGWDTAGASYLILPKPGAPTRYCIFVNEKWPNARAGYVEVDLAANGGAGGVVPPGTTWYMQHTTDKLTATTDSAETGYWVVQHVDSGDAFHAFHLSGLGLDPAPVVSHAGRSYLADTPGYINADRVRPMKFSPQGDKLGVITMGSDLDTNAIELFHFNRDAGTVDFWAQVANRQFALNLEGSVVPWHSTLNPFILDLEFSPDGNHMYYVNGDSILFAGSIYAIQVELANEDVDSIQYSAFGLMAIGNYNYPGWDPFGSFLLTGLNGHLYARANTYTINPNWLIDLFSVPLEMGMISGPNAIPLLDVGYLLYAPSGGNPVVMPNISKRYVDSAPVTTGLPHMEAITALRVWPNPGNSLIEVRWSGLTKTADARFTDATGRAVPGIWHLHPGENTMDISGLADGIYMLHVQSADEVSQVRIVKQ